MADETDTPGDVSSMMEELWGPRGEAPPDDIARPRRGVPASPPDIEGPARSEVEALRADLDTALAHLAEKVAGVRDDAVAAADARVAGAETWLLSRLDEIAAGVAQATQRSTVGHDILARLDVVEREASERWPALEERVGAAIEAVSEKVSGSAGTDAEAAGAIERRMTEAVDNLADRLRARQSELQSALEALQEHAKQTEYEMSELGELHAALDVGLGSLRSEMAELGDALRRRNGPKG